MFPEPVEPLVGVSTRFSPLEVLLVSVGGAAILIAAGAGSWTDVTSPGSARVEWGGRELDRWSAGAMGGLAGAADEGGLAVAADKGGSAARAADESGSAGTVDKGGSAGAEC